MTGRDWEFATPASKAKWHNKAKDTNYNFKPKLDSDVTSTQENIANAEGAYGSWDLIQTTSDPICSSAGCTQYEWPKPPPGPPMDYPVPDFGQDHDIEDSLDNERLASKMIGHQWKFKTAESKAKWHNKAKDTMYNFKPSLDSHIITSQKNLANAESKYGTWDLFL